MDKMRIYANSSEELANARNIQLQISQKQLELELLEIDIRYNISETDDFTTQRKRRAILNEINEVVSIRDTHISKAIGLALMLIEKELESSSHSNIFSLGGQAVNSINSFISSQKIELRLPLTIHMKLSQISSRLLFTGIEYMSVRTEVDRLKKNLNVF